MNLIDQIKILHEARLFVDIKLAVNTFNCTISNLCLFLTRFVSDNRFSVSVSVHILANNALRAHHASAHDGLSANGLSDICLIFF